MSLTIIIILAIVLLIVFFVGYKKKEKQVEGKDPSSRPGNNPPRTNT